VVSAASLAEERWKGLRLRGAREPLLSTELNQLQIEIGRLPRVAQRGTLDAFQQANEEAKVLDARVGLLMDQLDALDQMIVRSKETVAGNVQALAQAHAACDELAHQDPWLEFDDSRALIEQSAEAYLEAERQRGLGTTQGYQASITLAETARQRLAGAQEAIAALPEGARRIRSLLADLSSGSLADLRSRIGHVSDELKVYARHWEAGLERDSAQAISKLDQAQAELNAIPPDVRFQRRLRQSEVPRLIESLSHARSCLEEARELADGLDQERERIEALHRGLKRALEVISGSTIPAIGDKAQHMLPEIQERFRALETAFRKQAARMGDPAQVDYDQATNEWVPSIERRLNDLLSEHERSLKHYRAALKETFRRIERAWARLSKLDPGQSPGPEEDIEQLALDLDAWQTEAERGSEKPLVLREIVGPRAKNLEGRIETARVQIVEGRRTLDELSRQYQKCAQTTRNLRNATREMQRQSRWPKITWSTDQAERAWEEAIGLERQSRAAPTLAMAADQIQRGVSAALRAEQLYARIERQMETALRRLNEEWLSVAASLERASRQQAKLRERGLSPEATQIEELCARAERSIEMAQAAPTFEDALWHLRDASRTLDST